MSKLSDVQRVYEERNAMVLAFAWVADELGWKVGWADDAREPGWKVVLVDAPTGQCSWHVPGELVPEWMEQYDGEWDGHTTPEKYERLAELIRSD